MSWGVSWPASLRFKPLAPAEVNVVLNRARVGLCLSAAAGAMFASTATHPSPPQPSLALRITKASA